SIPAAARTGAARAAGTCARRAGATATCKRDPHRDGTRRQGKDTHRKSFQKNVVGRPPAFRQNSPATERPCRRLVPNHAAPRYFAAQFWTTAGLVLWLVRNFAQERRTERHIVARCIGAVHEDRVMGTGAVRCCRVDRYRGQTLAPDGGSTRAL